MRLSKIKLAGFKSFVEPTTLNVPGRLLAVVGPNGCGKSNIIDAVRWVMGESAASQLRGDSMEDVIFNGSAQRKPVGQAAVELVFDNSEHTLEGPWGQYNEVAIKRVVSRGAQSTYYINNTRCRRRDIAAIFLGTGLGPRSYAIIEQGTISRIIESKPDELRAFFEEAAGISKYKERRRETANRIRHTRDNLDRLNDLREEQQRQLAHLQRQARNAEKYRQHRAEEKRLKAQLLALRWRELNGSAGEQERLIRERETLIESLVAEQRRLEARQERARARAREFGEALERVQEQHYRVGTEIARTEQALENRRQLRERRRDEQVRTEQALTQIDAQSASDRERRDALAASLADDELQLERARELLYETGEQLRDAEQELADWQSRWDDFSRRAGDARRGADVERARIEQLERQQLQSRQRVERLQAERDAFSASAASGDAQLRALEQGYRDADAELARHNEALAELTLRHDEQRERERELDRRLAAERERLQTGRGRLGSLETLQQAALAEEDGASAAAGWRERYGIDDAPRLAERLRVEPAWERALEAVLGADLAALCVDDPARYARVLAALEEHDGDDASVPARAPGGAVLDGSGVGSAEPGSLAARLRGPVGAAAVELLAGVLTADSFAEAQARRGTLAAGMSLVTPDGVRVGRRWLRLPGGAGDGAAGVLARAQQIEVLQTELAALADALAALDDELNSARVERERLQQQQRDAQAALADRHRAALQAEAARDALVERLHQQRERQAALARDNDEQSALLAQSQHELVAARGRLETALADMEVHDAERAALERERDERRGRLADLRGQHEAARGATQQAELRVEAARSEQAGLTQALVRLDGQRERLLAARAQLAAEQDDDVGAAAADAEQRAALDALLARRADSDRALSEARQAVSAEDEELRQLERSLAELAERQQRERDALGERRLSNSETSVRRQTAKDQLLELGVTLEAVLPTLPDDAVEREWQERLSRIGERIQRLGAINLAAIDEFEQLSERKAYLDAQNDDLVDALKTLEAAMEKIDAETRSRFRDTFDRVNHGLQALFPRLFGGGRAYLELTGQDALDAGVTIMAHPPGKRNGTIHLLSGGEKALTAVAMIFAIFQLNPAPFCMLDEVDAPLDDANIGRFGELLNEISSQVQLIVVTHNKGTMEAASQLAGVTMHEPGVSRLVAVDVDEAVRLAGVE